MPAPKQSGHFDASTFCGLTDFRSAASASICRFSFFQRRRRKCSARNAGPLGKVVRPAAICSAVAKTSASSAHLATSAADGSLPVISLATFFIAAAKPAKASSSSLSVFVLKEVLGSPEVVETIGSEPTPRTPLSTGGTGGTSARGWGTLLAVGGVGGVRVAGNPTSSGRKTSYVLPSCFPSV